MKYIKTIIFATLAIGVWQFVEIKAPSSPSLHSTVQISISQSNFTAHADSSFLTKVLREDPSAGNHQWFSTLYSFSKGLLNMSLFLFLVYIAFRNILNLNIETYSIKKILPKLIFAAFLGNLIGPLITIGSSVVDAIVNSGATIFQTPGTMAWYGLVAGGGVGLIRGVTLLAGIGALFIPGTQLIGIGILIVQVLIELALFFAIMLMGLFLAIRPYVVVLACAAGPIAVGLSVLPETEKIFQKWYKIVIFWLAYPLVLNAVHYLADIITGFSGGIGNGPVAKLISVILPLVIKIGLFAFAVKLPFTWEKDVGGMLVSLPGSTIGGATKFAQGANKVAQATGRAVIWGRGWETSLRGKTREDAAAKRESSARADAQQNFRDAVSPVGPSTTPKMIADKRLLDGLRSNEYHELIKDEDNANDLQAIFGGQIPTHQKMRALYNRYQNGTLDLTGTSKEALRDQAAKAFFDNNKVAVESGTAKQFVQNRAAQLMQDSAEQAEKRLMGTDNDPNNKGDLKFRFFRGLQKYSVANIGNAVAAREEVYQAEFKKAGFRYDVMAKATAGPVADVKSQTARKESDFRQLKSSEQVQLEMSNTLRKLVDVLQHDMSKRAGRTVNREVAAAYLFKEAERLDQAAESTFAYNSEFLGRRGKGRQRVDSNDLGTMIAGHNRLRDLAASEARSVKSVDEQRQIQNQRVSSAYQRASSPSYSAGPGVYGRGNMGSVASDRMTKGDLRLEQALKMINQTLRRTSGVSALRQLNTAFQDIDFGEVTEDDARRFGVNSEGNLQEIGRMIFDKTNDSDLATSLTDRIRESRGFDTPAIISESPDTIKNSPQIVEMIADYGNQQLLHMVVTAKSEKLQVLKIQGENLAMKVTNDPSLAEKIDKALQTFTAPGEDRSITPAARQAAGAVLASQAGLSDPDALTPQMISSLARQLGAITIRDPENQPRPAAAPSHVSEQTSSDIHNNPRPNLPGGTS